MSHVTVVYGTDLFAVRPTPPRGTKPVPLASGEMSVTVPLCPTTAMNASGWISPTGAITTIDSDLVRAIITAEDTTCEDSPVVALLVHPATAQLVVAGVFTTATDANVWWLRRGDRFTHADVICHFAPIATPATRSGRAA